jgi:hypothetical protein
MKAQLRDHPFVTEFGTRSWPPVWLWMGGDEKTAGGEVGVLREVKVPDPSCTTMFLVIQHKSARFIGRLGCDEPTVSQKLSKFLNQHLGEELQVIGGMVVELPATSRRHKHLVSRTADANATA